MFTYHSEYNGKNTYQFHFFPEVNVQCTERQCNGVPWAISHVSVEFMSDVSETVSCRSVIIR